jgi:hypothetical protein
MLSMRDPTINVFMVSRNFFFGGEPTRAQPIKKPRLIDVLYNMTFGDNQISQNVA